MARAKGERFNVFSILGMESDEVKTHSALLADLLNPQGSHSQGTVFLRLFFAMLRENFPQQKFKWELSDDESNYFTVTVEASRSGYGRIDILIESSKKCMVIENKIYAGDQERQLGRYYDYAEGKFNEEDIAVIYLTLDGAEPNDYTLGELSEDKVLCVSYSQHIIKWLDECMKETVRIAHIRETIFQYQALLKKLTSQTMNREFIMETNELFRKDNNYKLIPQLKESIDAFNTNIQCNFWKNIDAAIKEEEEFFKHCQNQKITYTKDSYSRVWKIPYQDNPKVNVIARIVEDSHEVTFSFFLEREIEGEDGWISNYDDGLDETHRKLRDAAIKIKNMKKMKWCLSTGDRSWEYSDENFIKKMMDAKEAGKLAGEVVDLAKQSIKSIEPFLKQPR